VASGPDKRAQAALADNAAAVAGAENDPVAMKLAIATYEVLLATATSEQETSALTTALTTLRKWKA